MKSEKEETLQDEVGESPAVEKQEIASGKEEHIIPEDFQRKCHAFVAGLSAAQLDYLQQCCSKRYTEVHELIAEEETTFSDEDMPE